MTAATRPTPDARGCVAVIAENDQNRDRRKRFDLFVCVRAWTATRFDEHEPLGGRRIEQRRCQRKRARLRVSHQHRAVQLTGEIR
jgi:hypothetical protein